MRVFCEIRTCQKYTKIKIYLASWMLIITFVMSIVGILLITNLSHNMLEATPTIEVFDNLALETEELELSCDKEYLINEYIKMSGDVSVFWIIFDIKQGQLDG